MKTGELLMLSPRSSSLTGIRSRSHIIGHLDFQTLTPNDWRIVDVRLPEGSVDALVGFVACQDGMFYATRMRHPLESVPFASLNAVANFIMRADLV